MRTTVLCGTAVDSTSRDARHAESTVGGTTAMSNCRFCGTPISHTFVDLGMSPLCESFVSEEQANHMEPFYPLHALVCGKCFLVQLDEYVTPDEIFSDYDYFSSYSDSWVAHAKHYVEKMVDSLQLDRDSLVMEIASNDGYLLQHLVAMGIPCLGIEPAANVAAVAEQKGVRSVVKFFGTETARQIADEYGKPQLLLGNNVLAHTPHLNDFVAGLKILLKEDGIVTMEFPHLQRLVEGNQFDTIYHEHFSYFSFMTVREIFAAHGLRIFDLEEISTHGGSLRIYACHKENVDRPDTDICVDMLTRERAAGTDDLDMYSQFSEKVQETKRGILEFLIQEKRNGKQIVGYGAPGKGNTLLNYCGIRQDFLDYTVDRNPYKHGKYTPGTRIPIFDPDRISATKPDYIFVLPWNLETEIVDQMSFAREWGARFVIPIPSLHVL
jgi:2-polyprenyl-3-methyl-5-hydroxy-6-metoxy-1,4-benzoquinol methylase